MTAGPCMPVFFGIRATSDHDAVQLVVEVVLANERKHRLADARMITEVLVHRQEVVCHEHDV